MKKWRTIQTMTVSSATAVGKFEKIVLRTASIFLAKSLVMCVSGLVQKYGFQLSNEYSNKCNCVLDKRKISV